MNRKIAVVSAAAVLILAACGVTVLAGKSGEAKPLSPEKSGAGFGTVAFADKKVVEARALVVKKAEAEKKAKELAAKKKAEELRKAEAAAAKEKERQNAASASAGGNGSGGSRSYAGSDTNGSSGGTVRKSDGNKASNGGGKKTNKPVQGGNSVTDRYKPGQSWDSETTETGEIDPDGNTWEEGTW